MLPEEALIMVKLESRSLHMIFLFFEIPHSYVRGPFGCYPTFVQILSNIYVQILSNIYFFGCKLSIVFKLNLISNEVKPILPNLSKIFSSGGF